MDNVISKHNDSLYYSSVTWKICNYLNGPLEVDKPIISREFETKLCEPIKWTIALTGRRKLDENYVTEVLLRRSPSRTGPEHLKVKVRISVESSNGEVWYDSVHDDTLAVNGAITFFLPDILQDRVDCSKPSENDSETLRIRCDFLHDVGFQCNIDADLKMLSDDLKKVCMTGHHRNLNLLLDSHVFPVHSVIVRWRSPYIARILKENPTLREIDLTGKCSFSQLSGLITYWYSGDLGNIPRMQSPSTFNLILNMEQLELRRYVVPETIVVSTTFHISHKRVNWLIDNSELCENLRDLKNPINYPYTSEENAWKLYFYPKGTSGDSDHFSLHVEELSKGFRDMVYLEVYMMDAYGTEYGSKRTISALHPPGQYKFENFITHDEFVKIRETLLKTNTLSFGCLITYGTGPVKNRISSVSDSDILSLKEDNNPYIALTKEFKNLFESQCFSDLSLKVSDGTFEVHKAILAARSSYFDGLFRNQGNEVSKPDEQILNDIERDDLEMILKYVYYAEKIELNFELALKLYPVLNKYKINGLEDFCSNYLQNNIIEGNVVSIRQLAEKHNDHYLKKCADNFILENGNRH